MSFEEEFDRIIQRKADEMDFPFDEQNWEKARKMLDNERKTVGVGFSAKTYVLALFLFVAASSVGYFVYRGFINPSSTNMEMLSGKTDIANNVTSEPGNTVAEKGISAPEAIIHKDLTGSVEKNGMGLPMNTENLSVNKTAYDRAAEPIHEMNADKILADRGNASTVEKSALAANGQRDADDVKVAVNSGVADNSGNAFPALNPGDGSATENAGGAAVNPVEGEGRAQDQKSSEHGDLAIETLAQIFPKQHLFAAPEIIPTTLNTLNYFDEDYYTPEKRKTHYLDVEAGAAYLLGWQAKNGKDGQGINWFGGVNYGFYVSKKISLSAGIQAYNMGHIENPFFNNKNTEYGFNAKSTQTLITTNSLYYLSFPLRVAYAINAQNQIGAGCNISLLVSSRNTEEMYFYQSDVRTDKTSIKTTGYYEGMNTTQVMASMFYKTKLGKRLYLNGEATFAPFNIYKYANSQVNTANTFGFRLSLQYTLFEK